MLGIMIVSNIVPLDWGNWLKAVPSSLGCQLIQNIYMIILIANFQVKYKCFGMDRVVKGLPNGLVQLEDCVGNQFKTGITGLGYQSITNNPGTVLSIQGLGRND